MLTGKRTMITLAVLLMHQLCKAIGIDVPDEQLSAVMDTVFILGAGVFSWAKQRRLDSCTKP